MLYTTGNDTWVCETIWVTRKKHKWVHKRTRDSWSSVLYDVVHWHVTKPINAIQHRMGLFRFNLRSSNNKCSFNIGGRFEKASQTFLKIQNKTCAHEEQKTSSSCKVRSRIAKSRICISKTRVNWLIRTRELEIRKTEIGLRNLN